jgi:hypothetical protein
VRQHSELWPALHGASKQEPHRPHPRARKRPRSRRTEARHPFVRRRQGRGEGREPRKGLPALFAGPIIGDTRRSVPPARPNMPQHGENAPASQALTGATGKFLAVGSGSGWAGSRTPTGAEAAAARRPRAGEGPSIMQCGWRCPSLELTRNPRCANRQLTGVISRRIGGGGAVESSRMCRGGRKLACGRSARRQDSARGTRWKRGKKADFERSIEARYTAVGSLW